MDRRQFVKLTGIGVGGLMLPIVGRVVSAEDLLDPGMDFGTKKRLGTIALEAATKAGASYADARIGRYLNQFVTAQETRVDNIVNTESAGIGVRVIADGTWGFAATSDLTPDSIARTAEKAVAIAKANAKFQTSPVELAPVKGAGDVRWQTPIRKNAFEVPVEDKVDLLMEVNNTAMENGANFITSVLFQVNEKKFFASTDGWNAPVADDRADPVYLRHQVLSRSERALVDRWLDDLGVVRLAAGDLKARVEASRRAVAPEPVVTETVVARPVT